MTKQFPHQGFEIIEADNGDIYLRVGESLYSPDSVLGALEAQFSVDVDETEPALPREWPPHVEITDYPNLDSVAEFAQMIDEQNAKEAPPLKPREPITISRSVHFVSAGSPGMYPSTCRAAIVTEVLAPSLRIGDLTRGAQETETVNLLVANPQGIHFPSHVLHDPNLGRGTWHWHWECPLNT